MKKRKPIGALAISLYYLNQRTGELTWRRDLAVPHESGARELSKSEGKLFGIASATELRNILDRFQDFGTELLSLDPAFGSTHRSRRVQVLREFFNRAGLTLVGFAQEEKSGRLVPSWSTANNSCEEMLYGILAIALQEEAYWPIAKCVACECFFAKPSHRSTKYCSNRCRKRVQVARYRERHPDQYRDYQRELMQSRDGRIPHQTTSTGVDDETTS